MNCSLRSRQECVPARTSVPNASTKSPAGREKNGGSLVAKIPPRSKPVRELAASPQKVSRAHPLPPATQATAAEETTFPHVTREKPLEQSVISFIAPSQ